MQCTSLSSLGVTWNTSGNQPYEQHEVDIIVNNASSPSRGSESSFLSNGSLGSHGSELGAGLFSDTELEDA